MVYNIKMSVPPKKLAIYYGWPSTVTYSVNGAADVFKAYDIVVFGSGLQDSSHGDHQNTADIIADTDMANTNVYGYVDTTEAQGTLETKIDDWDTMGVNGIFCDQYGYDFGVTREHQNEVVDYIHTVDLNAFVNSWDPDNAFSSAVVTTYNSDGTGHNLGSSDWFLAESWVVTESAYETKTAWKTRADKLDTYKSTSNIACVTTTDATASPSMSMVRSHQPPGKLLRRQNLPVWRCNFSKSECRSYPGIRRVSERILKAVS